MSGAGASETDEALEDAFPLGVGDAGSVVLSGGFAGDKGLLADTWSYHPGTNTWSYHPGTNTWSYHPGTNTWQQLHPGGTTPSRRDFSAAAYDRRAGMMILFGGLTGGTGNVNGTVLNDTWHALDGGR